MTGKITPEQLTKFILYSEWVVHSTWWVGNHWSSLMQAIGASEKVFQLLDLAPSKQLSVHGNLNYQIKLWYIVSQYHGKIYGLHLKLVWMDLVDELTHCTLLCAQASSCQKLKDVFNLLKSLLVTQLDPKWAESTDFQWRNSQFFVVESVKMLLDGKAETLCVRFLVCRVSWCSLCL